jgi:hypothetical protein
VTKFAPAIQFPLESTKARQKTSQSGAKTKRTRADTAQRRSAPSIRPVPGTLFLPKSFVPEGRAVMVSFRDIQRTG